MEETTKQLAQIGVVRLVIKTKRSAVVKISCKLRYKAYRTQFTGLLKHVSQTTQTGYLNSRLHYDPIICCYSNN